MPMNIVNGGVVVLFILFLTGLPLRYDFGTCFYPSREFPYFTSGRLISGIPFLVITASEIATSTEVFASSYNFFHLQ